MLRVFLIFCIQDLTNSDTVITCYAGFKITGNIRRRNLHESKTVIRQNFG
jgi:hypothetical protein